AGQTILVASSAGTSTVGADLPAADATMSIDLSGTNGQVILANGTSALTLPAGAVSNVDVIDFVGYGTAVTREGTNAAPALTSSTSPSRDASGTDTDQNGTDFTATPPAPVACTGCTATPLPTFTGSIAEIQGTGPVAAKNAHIATTTGVVTARYPSGGFNGFYLQTDGTGGAVDATPGASDAIFVFL